MRQFHDVISELRQPTRELKDAIPDAWAGFAALHDRALAEGALPAHVKELVALAVAVSKECDGCIAYNVRAAGGRAS